MRAFCILLVLFATVACGEKKPKAESVEKYCVLTSLPHSTAPQLRAINQRGLDLFREKKPYKVNPANKRVVNAATQVVTVTRTAVLQLENPKLFPGYTKPVGLDEALKELTVACARLPKEKT